jgi:hypothetical protein
MIDQKGLEILKSKQFFRFTGTPEHWLTAIKFKTWGLRSEHMSRWQKIQVGDVFLMHSTLKSDYKGAKSSIIGVGIVGPGLRQKTVFLWEEEYKKNENIYPLLVPFSEIYLFSPTLDVSNWDSHDKSQTERSIKDLLIGAVPLPKGFPPMGSFSEIKQAIGFDILRNGLPENVVEADLDQEVLGTTHTKLSPMKSSREGLRYTPTLKYLVPKAARKYKEKTSLFERDNELMERAEEDHQGVIDAAISILEKLGYRTFGNLHVDLAAENEQEILLFEAKSIPKNKFRDQARRGLGQLYQYEYFDIGNHQRTNETQKPVSKKLLIPSDPGDLEYRDFLRWANVDVTVPDGGRLIDI